MAKVYSKVNWGTNTQVSVTSLDKMDVGIDAIDTKLDSLLSSSFLLVKGKLPALGWQASLTYNLPTWLGNYPIVVSARYKNANNVWLNTEPGNFSVTTGGNGSYVSIQNDNTALQGFDFEITLMSRNSVTQVTI